MEKNLKTAAAILCGGQSRRMGFDKALGLRSRDGRPLLAALAEELSGRFGEVLLVTNQAAKLAALKDLPPTCRAVEDLHPGAGPAGAIHTALAACPGRAVFVLPCDLLAINWPLIERLRALVEAGAGAAVPCRNGRWEPLYAFYGPAAEPVLARGLAEGQRKILDFYPHIQVARLDMDEDEAGFMVNLNTPADVERAGLPRPQHG